MFTRNAFCRITTALIAAAAICAAPGAAGSGNSQSGSLMVRAMSKPDAPGPDSKPLTAKSMSLFAVEEPKPREFHRHDLVQIVVRENSSLRRRTRFDTDRSYSIDGGINAFPRLTLEDLVNFKMHAGRTNDLPQLDIDMNRRFDSDGEKRDDEDLTARLTAEVIEILPNGNLVLEARTHLMLDSEETVLKVTGVCRPDDVTGNNTIMSNQLHNLHIERMTEGELKRNSEKGLIPRVLDTLFHF